MRKGKAEMNNCNGYVPSPGCYLILKQYYLGCLAHASYLLGDEASSTAIIVDPQRDSTLSTLGNLASKSATSS
jgi:hypothetical protein